MLGSAVHPLMPHGCSRGALAEVSAERRYARFVRFFLLIAEVCARGGCFYRLADSTPVSIYVFLGACARRTLFLSLSLRSASRQAGYRATDSSLSLSFSRSPPGKERRDDVSAPLCKAVRARERGEREREKEMGRRAQRRARAGAIEGENARGTREKK